VKQLDGSEVESIKAQLNPDLEIPGLLELASSLLSQLTQLTGVVALPRRNRNELRQVEFLPLSANRVLVILVLNDREVQNRVIYTDRIYSPTELQQAANYINMNYAGSSLLTVRAKLIKAIRHDRETMACLLQAAIDVGNKAFVDPPEFKKDYILAGQNNLLNCSQTLSDLEQLRLLFAAFTEKQEILNLLDQALEAEGIQIFIGRESGYEALGDCSIVTSSYSVDGQLLGSLGVIGLMRMPYDRVISAVDVTAKLLSAALNQSSSAPI
jgi:heat-inducible transcriptional repressor